MLTDVATRIMIIITSKDDINIKFQQQSGRISFVESCRYQFHMYSFLFSSKFIANRFLMVKSSNIQTWILSLMILHSEYINLANQMD